MNEATMIDFLLGATTTANMVLALIFLRFYRRVRDRFFLYFTAAFALEGVSQLCIWAFGPYIEHGVTVFVIRLVAYSLILLAILDKNLPKGSADRRE
jgi:hypothetical protein